MTDPTWVMLAGKRRLEMASARTEQRHLGGAAIRHTSVGPVVPQIYGNGLQNLARDTSDSLNALRGELLMSDPCYERGVKHSHPECKLKRLAQESLETRVHSKLAVAPKWQNTGVSFASWDDFDQNTPRTPRNDGASPAKHFTFCTVCASPEEHWEKIRQKSSRPRPTRPQTATFHERQAISYPNGFKATIKSPAVAKTVRKREDVPSLHPSFKITVITGSQSGAHTSALVTLIFGQSSDDNFSAPLLDTRRQPAKFGSSSEEVFHFTSPTSALPKSLKVRLDGRFHLDDWFLETIDVESCDRVVRFSYNAWVQLDANGHAELEMRITSRFAAKSSDDRKEQVLEKVERRRSPVDAAFTVVTGSTQFAGTNSRVYVILTGSKGSTPKLHLRPPKGHKSRMDCFNKGSTDEFHIQVPDVGTPRSLRLETDGTGTGAGWFCEEVRIKLGRKIFTFPCNTWLSTDEGDKQLWKTLTPMDGHQASSTKSRNNALVPYELSFTTSDVKFAGTDAKIFVQFVGSDGQTPKISISARKEHFERGATDVFKVSTSAVGELSQLRIGHDNTGLAAGWHLKQVRVKRLYGTADQQDFSSELRVIEQRLCEKSLEKMIVDCRLAEVRSLMKKVPVSEDYEFDADKWLSADKDADCTELVLEVSRHKLNMTSKKRLVSGEESVSEESD